jgi:hypothetical protein
MGLFDGIKEAFQAPTLERSYLDAERETPIDRWMGWNAKSSDEKKSSIPAGKHMLYFFVTLQQLYLMVKHVFPWTKFPPIHL